VFARPSMAQPSHEDAAAAPPKPGPPDLERSWLRSRWSRRRRLLVGLFSVWVMDAGLEPSFDRVGYANERACFANQAVLRAAVEKDAAGQPPPRAEDGTGRVDLLVAKGALPGRMLDPGEGPWADDHYAVVLRRDRTGAAALDAFCTRHGFVDPPPPDARGAGPRAQLVAAGCSDAALLARASRSFPGRVSGWARLYNRRASDVLVAGLLFAVLARAALPGPGPTRASRPCPDARRPWCHRRRGGRGRAPSPTAGRPRRNDRA
jgi:hypothetical protein